MVWSVTLTEKKFGALFALNDVYLPPEASVVSVLARLTVRTVVVRLAGALAAAATRLGAAFFVTGFFTLVFLLVAIFPLIDYFILLQIDCKMAMLITKVYMKAV